MGVRFMGNKIDQFKQAMGNYPTGVSVVTAYNEEDVPMGLTINSFASVSLNPTLILWSIDNSVSTYDDFQKVERFSINILASDQGELCQLFASRVEDRFANCEWEKSDLELPVLKDTMATLQCKVHNRVEAGDHMIMIGEVLEITNSDKEPLLYHKRHFGQIPETFYQ